jgi:hypothetical protein
LAAGDYLYSLYRMVANGDVGSHLRVFVTVAKTEAS